MERNFMQIRSEYTSFQNKSSHGHTHHITECMHDEHTSKKLEAGGGPAKGTGQAQNKALEYSKDGDFYQMNVPISQKEGTGRTKGSSLIKGFWDALGEEGTAGEKNVAAIFKENLLSGVHGAADAVKNAFHRQITDRIVYVRDKIKISTEKALSRFSKGRHSFASLTGGETSSKRRQPDRKNREEQLSLSSAAKKEEIPMKALKHSHLMDSYSRRGEYCQINENLTYQKPQGEAAAKKPRSV